MARVRKRQINVGLDDGMRAKLDAFADKHGRSIADEIRQRIEYSLDEEGLDERTWWLTHQIKRLARDVQHATGVSWYTHPLAHIAFVEAIATLLEKLKPALPPNESSPTETEQQEAKAVGRTITRLIRHHPEEPVFASMPRSFSQSQIPHPRPAPAQKRRK
jgi:hypothetical protein